MENIDAFIFINLDHRRDRLIEIINELSMQRIPAEKVFKISGVVHSSPCVGCSLAHIKALKFAKEKEFKHFVIFEDDFMFIVPHKMVIDNIRRFFVLNLDYRVVMLSYNLKIAEPFNDVVGYAREVTTASGYLVNRIYVDELIECLQYGVDMLEKTGEHWNYMNDQIWIKLQKEKWYYFMTRLGCQRSSFSDCSGELKFTGH